MELYTVCEWLDWIAALNDKEIELGLDRVKEVAERLHIKPPTHTSVITIGGTNGKGSTVEGLNAIYLAAGYHVGAFTSPMLFKFNEQVRINGKPIEDDLLCQAFSQIEKSRGDIRLTPFEYHTLAALLIFQKFPLDVWLLEVGLGGRLDAVNIIDADVAIVTSIDLDHMDWLGETREKIASEKAGIFRANKPAICGDLNPPNTLIQKAQDLNAPLFCQNKNFSYHQHEMTWTWQYEKNKYKNLPLCALALQNMSTVMMAVQLLQEKLPVSRMAIDEALTKVNLPGRVQIIPGEVTKIFDVSHNPASIAYLAKRLHEMPCHGKTLAVFSMLADKDINDSVAVIADQISKWYVAPLFCKRAANAESLKKIFQSLAIQTVDFSASIETAYSKAQTDAQPGDRIIMFGSFHTIAALYYA